MSAVIERTDPQLTWAAGHFFLQMNRLRKIGFGPLDVRRPEQRDHRSIERRSKMTRSTVGGDQQIAFPTQAFVNPSGKIRSDSENTWSRSDCWTYLAKFSSSGPHRTSTFDPRRSTSCRASAENEATGQCLDAPNAPPELRQMISFASCKPNRSQTSPAVAHRQGW